MKEKEVSSSPGASGPPHEMSEIGEIEAKLFIEGVRLAFGYDFSQYSEPSFRRRLQNLLNQMKLETPLALLQRLFSERELFRQILPSLTVGTTEMFRDPQFFKALRSHVIPTLRTYPSLNIWSAGCSTGEELYSLAILLLEENLLERCVIFATDINPVALKAAEEGIFALETLENIQRNYLQAGGQKSIEDYFTIGYGFMKASSSLKTNMVLSEHNLINDHVFAECHLVICRNVLIYFNRPSQENVIDLFKNSLRRGGFLGLGSKESLRFSQHIPFFETLDAQWRIYQKRSRQL